MPSTGTLEVSSTSAAPSIFAKDFAGNTSSESPEMEYIARLNGPFSLVFDGANGYVDIPILSDGTEDNVSEAKKFNAATINLRVQNLTDATEENPFPDGEKIKLYNNLECSGSSSVIFQNPFELTGLTHGIHHFSVSVETVLEQVECFAVKYFADLEEPDSNTLGLTADSGVNPVSNANCDIEA